MKRTDITELFPEAPKEAVDKLMAINGADINAAKGDLDELRRQLQQAQSGADLQQAQQKIAELDKELTAMKTAETLRGIRAKVAGEKKIPAELLTGETEEACAKQADAILAFAKPAGGYPSPRDGGEPSSGTSGATTRDKFAAWASENL